MPVDRLNTAQLKRRPLMPIQVILFYHARIYLDGKHGGQDKSRGIGRYFNRRGIYCWNLSKGWGLTQQTLGPLYHAHFWHQSNYHLSFLQTHWQSFWSYKIQCQQPLSCYWPNFIQTEKTTFDERQPLKEDNLYRR